MLWREEGKYLEECSPYHRQFRTLLLPLSLKWLSGSHLLRQVATFCLSSQVYLCFHFLCCPCSKPSQVKEASTLLRLLLGLLYHSLLRNFQYWTRDTGYLFTLYKHLLNYDSVFFFFFPMNFLTVREYTMNSDSSGGV